MQSLRQRIRYVNAPNGLQSIADIPLPGNFNIQYVFVNDEVNNNNDQIKMVKDLSFTDVKEKLQSVINFNIWHEFCR